MVETYLDANRLQWDERADIHIDDATGFYGVDRFLAGEDMLTPIDASEIGDVAGLNVLHLQCHIGLDTLSLARRGARATGLDFSPNALRHARDLADKTGLTAALSRATFMRRRRWSAATSTSSIRPGGR